MEDEHEPIKAIEKPSIKRVTSEIYNNNNTSGYVSDSSENDVIVDTEVSESVASQRSVLNNSSNQFSGLTAGGSTSGKCDETIDADISKPAVPERSDLENLWSQLSSLTTSESQAPHHGTVSLQQLSGNKASSDLEGSLQFPSPPKHSPIYNVYTSQLRLSFVPTVICVVWRHSIFLPCFETMMKRTFSGRLRYS